MIGKTTMSTPIPGLILLMAATSPVSALDITLPRETVTYQASELPGYKRVQQNCLVCHSAHYVMYQPPGSPRGYWDAIVRKMKHPFGAFFPDEDIAPMVDYLVKTYGAERTTITTGAAPPLAHPSMPSN